MAQSGVMAGGGGAGPIPRSRAAWGRAVLLARIRAGPGSFRPSWGERAQSTSSSNLAFLTCGMGLILALKLGMVED